MRARLLVAAGIFLVVVLAGTGVESLRQGATWLVRTYVDTLILAATDQAGSEVARGVFSELGEVLAAEWDGVLRLHDIG